jgi:hypothetical protein
MCINPCYAFASFRLDTGYTVKVSDGSLSQLFYPECYSYHRGTIRPVRWAAVETLKQGQCTSASNVVSELKEKQTAYNFVFVKSWKLG